MTSTRLMEAEVLLVKNHWHSAELQLLKTTDEIEKLPLTKEHYFYLAEVYEKLAHIYKSYSPNYVKHKNNLCSTLEKLIKLHQAANLQFWNDQPVNLHSFLYRLATVLYSFHVLELPKQQSALQKAEVIIKDALTAMKAINLQDAKYYLLAANIEIALGHSLNGYGYLLLAKQFATTEPDLINKRIQKLFQEQPELVLQTSNILITLNLADHFFNKQTDKKINSERVSHRLFSKIHHLDERTSDSILNQTSYKICNH